MKVDFKKELISASKGMIMIHDPKTLIKLIIRMLIRKLEIRHAAMVLYEPERDAYVLGVSRGETGFKIPTGYTKFEKTNPLIRIFTDKHYRPLVTKKNAIVARDIQKLIWKEGLIENGNGTKAVLHAVEEQMDKLNANICVPAFYQDKLLALLLLGDKQNLEPYDDDECEFFHALASDAAMAIRNAQLFTGLKREARRNRELFIQTIIVLSSTIEAKDSYTHGHTERVTGYALAIARQMRFNGSLECEDSFFENLYIGALLHDIGKIAVPEKILNKTGRLTDPEREQMNAHTVRGAEMVKPLGLPKAIIDCILYHHERFDGKGYPQGLSGEGIPTTAAILAVADAYDAMTSDRPYRKGFSREKALDEVRRNVNLQFAPMPVKAFLELASAGKI